MRARDVADKIANTAGHAVAKSAEMPEDDALLYLEDALRSVQILAQRLVDAFDARERHRVDL